MNLLSIDTTAKVCSVTLHQQGQLLSGFHIYSEKVASAQLAPMIEAILAKNNLSPQQLDAVAVAKGPGSYTGLRIGTSTAKGLCVAMDIPLLAVNSLQAMAYQIADLLPAEQVLCPMIDARRMEVYCMLLNPDMTILQETKAEIIEEGAFGNLLNEKSVVFFGDGAEKCKPVLGQHPNAVFWKKPIWPNAESVGYLAYQKYLQNDFENLVTFEPYYLKEFMGNKPAYS